jgi:PucR C-terminal helix-turn-helix domain
VSHKASPPTPTASPPALPLEEGYANMIRRLRARQPEIQAAILARVRVVSGSEGLEDAEYQAALGATVAAVVDFGLTCIEQGEALTEPIPSAAIAQARRAARNGISLQTIVLRYIAGHRLLGEFVGDEADNSGLASHGITLRHLRRVQEAVLERLTATIAHEHNHERERLAGSAEQRSRELVQKLLAGEPADTSAVDYEFDNAWHLGVIATGSKAGRTVRGLADGLARQILSVTCGDGWTVWAWFGGRRRPAVADVERLLSPDGTTGVSLAIGEPGRGIDGWRLTHLEAQAALLVALRNPQMLTRCADVPLEAAVLRHEALTRSLVGSYLSPLDGLRMGGQVARETLRAYFTCERNTSSAAHLLGVARHTVENRLREIEKVLGRSLHTCLAELEVVLRLETFGDIVRLDAPLLP